jgi:hypothetical protein
MVDFPIIHQEWFTLTLGLRMTLDLQTHKYMGQFGSTAGAVVSILTHDQAPSSTAAGIQAAPGFETSIGVRLRVINRLSEPYKSMCMTEYPTHLLPFAIHRGSSELIRQESAIFYYRREL